MFLADHQQYPSLEGVHAALATWIGGLQVGPRTTLSASGAWYFARFEHKPMLIDSVDTSPW